VDAALQLPLKQPKFIPGVREAIWFLHYSFRTEKVYV
jgi:hypothetical protein